MNTDPKILILTGSYGNGHLKVTKTLKDTFVNLGYQRIIESDLYLESHPLITKVSKYLYIKSFTFGQNIYGMFYYWGNKQEKYFQEDFMNYYGMKTLIEMVDSLKPDLIVNTFPMLVVPQFRKKTGIDIPIVNVLTDYGLHKNWIHKEIDKYYVASESLKHDMAEKGIPRERIKVTGIPITPSFEEECDRDLLFESYQLDVNKPVILIAAGAFGVLKDLEKIVNRILAKSDSQLIVVCGNNAKLKEKLTISCSGDKNVRILGYTNKMDELMKMATLMVTKPGGITLSEALSVQVPLILYRSVPGQERENAIFFEENGASVNVDTPDELIDNIIYLIDNEKVREDMRKKMKKLYYGNAAKVICEDIIALLNSKKINLNKVTV